MCIVPRFSLTLQKIGCTRHKCSSKLGIFCTHLHYLCILEWYTPARGLRHTCPPPVPLRFFCFGGGLRYTPCSPLSSNRERVTLPLSTGGQCLPLRPLPACRRGQPRQYDCLIQRFSVWSGFMALWAGIATPQQAQEIVARQYRDTTLFCCPAGVRSLSPLEKMYNTKAGGNPRRGRGRYRYVSTISSSVGSSGTDTPPRHVSWHGRQSYSSAGILSASEPSTSIICLRMASLC